MVTLGVMIVMFSLAFLMLREQLIAGQKTGNGNRQLICANQDTRTHVDPHLLRTLCP